MGASVPARIRWAVERLGVRPGEQVLEIGCGPGIAVSLIAGRLGEGVITAIDRSPAMLARARARNEAHLASGRAVLLAGALADVPLDPGRFGLAFAVNVNLFWIRVTRELDVLRAALAPDGALHLFYEPPSPARAEEIARRASTLLLAHRFSTREVHHETLGRSSGVHIVAEPERAPARPLLG